MITLFIQNFNKVEEKERVFKEEKDRDRDGERQRKKQTETEGEGKFTDTHSVQPFQTL